MRILLESQGFIEFISQPWHWAVSGTAIAMIMFIMTWMGRFFGVSTAFKNICVMCGARKANSFFDIDLKAENWRMIFIAGGVVGGFIAANFLANPETIALSEANIEHLSNWNISPDEGNGFIPDSIFHLGNWKGMIIAIIGGFLVGFGARYGDGCTSGHAISGLSHLQLPSLITVIGFFIGGLIMTWLIMPMIFG